MKKNFALSIFTLASVGVFAQNNSALDTTTIAKPLIDFVTSFNQRSLKLPPGIFTNDAVIVDLFSPYTWIGKKEIDEWYSTLMGKTPEEQVKQAASQQQIKIFKLSYLSVQNNAAYLSAPAELSYVSKGEKKLIKGYWTITLRLVSGRWLMSTNVWAVVSI